MANLAVIALHEGDWERAAHLLAESWEPGPPYSVHGVHDVAHFILVVFAGVFAARKQPVVAATLLGAARAEVDRLEENLDPPDQRVYDTALATASQDLSTGTFLAAWEHGQAMGPGEAFAYGQAQLERS